MLSMVVVLPAPLRPTRLTASTSPGPCACSGWSRAAQPEARLVDERPQEHRRRGPHRDDQPVVVRIRVAADEKAAHVPPQGVGCGAPVLRMVGLAFAGLSSGTVALLSGLSRVIGAAVLVGLGAGVVYLAWRVGPPSPPITWRVYNGYINRVT